MERPSIRYDPWTARSTPYRKVPCHTRTRTSSSGRYRNDSSCGVSTTMPTMAITLKKNFHAKNNGINFLAVYVDGRQVPAKPLQPNFETGHYVRSYVNLFSASGKQAQDEGNELTRDDFGKGYTFFCFDLTPDACDGGCFHLVRKGNLRIEIHFATALTQTVNVVVYGEFEAVLEIDKGRNVIYDC